MGAGDGGRGKTEVSGARCQVSGTGPMPPRSIGADFIYEIPRQIEAQMKVQIGALTLRKQDNKKVLWIS